MCEKSSSYHFFKMVWDTIKINQVKILLKQVVPFLNGRKNRQKCSKPQICRMISVFIRSGFAFLYLKTGKIVYKFIHSFFFFLSVLFNQTRTSIISSVRRQDSAKKICRKLWMIGIDGDRGPGNLLLSTHLDDLYKLS